MLGFSNLRKLTYLPIYLSRLLYWELYSRFHDTITFSTIQGKFTVSCRDQGIGKTLFGYKQFEGNLIKETFLHLQSRGKIPSNGTGTIVDIGANIGVIGIGAAYMGLVKNIIAIEPDPNNFALLTRNIQQNGLDDRSVCLPYAVAEQEGELQFELSRDNFGDHRLHSDNFISSGKELFDESKRQIIHVRSKPLDEIVNQLSDKFTNDISLVWVDVQGYEGYVFSSGHTFFKRGMPVMVEIWPYGVRRAGMRDDQFCEIVKGLWKEYWRLVDGKYQRFSIESFQDFYVGFEYGHFENVIFE
jgi:FkbM family methyltransferase